MSSSLIMRNRKVHIAIITFIIIYAIVTYLRVDPQHQFGVMSWFPVFILAGTYVGILFVKHLLPNMVYRATNSVLGSNAEIEHDPLHDARAALARGDYEEAIEIYRSISAEDPSDPQPWISQSMIEKNNLANPPLAIKTLRKAISSHDWTDDERAFFMARIADIQINSLTDHAEASVTLQEIIDTFPETRHSANAAHKLHDLN